MIAFSRKVKEVAERVDIGCDGPAVNASVEIAGKDLVCGESFLWASAFNVDVGDVAFSI